MPPLPQNFNGGSRMALWIRVLGINCLPQARMVVWVGLVSRSGSEGLKKRVLLSSWARGMPP